MSESWQGPWVAKFTDGPRKGETRYWAVGPIWNEIKMAPTIGSKHKGWFICGGDGIPPMPGDKEEEPWPGEVLYRLRRTRQTRVVGEQTMVAYYRKA